MSIVKKINEKDVSVIADLKAKVLEKLSGNKEYVELQEEIEKLGEAGIKIKIKFDKGIKHSDLSKEQKDFLTSITKDNFDDKMKSDENTELFGYNGYEVFADFKNKELEIAKKD